MKCIKTIHFTNLKQSSSDLPRSVDVLILHDRFNEWLPGVHPLVVTRRYHAQRRRAVQLLGPVVDGHLRFHLGNEKLHSL